MNLAVEAAEAHPSQRRSGPLVPFPEIANRFHAALVVVSVSLGAFSATAAAIWGWSGGWRLAGLAVVSAAFGVVRWRSGSTSPEPVFAASLGGLLVASAVGEIGAVAWVVAYLNLVVGAFLVLPRRRALLVAVVAAAAQSAAFAWAPPSSLVIDAERLTVIIGTLAVLFTGQTVVVAVATAAAVGERRVLAEALAASEERYRSLFEENPHPMFVYDPQDLSIRAVNRATADQYGYTTDELTSMTIADLRPPEDVPRLRQYLQSRGGDGDAGVWRHVRKDGSLLWVRVRSQSLPEPHLRLVMLDDVTAEVQSEARLAEARDRLEAVLAGIPIVVFELDREGRFLFAAGAGLQPLDVEPEDLVGIRADEAFPTASTVLDDLLERVASGREVSESMQVAGRRFEVRLAPAERSSRSDAPVLGVALDVTEQLEMEERTRVVTQAVHDGVLLCDAAGVVNYANPAAERIFSASGEGLWGKNLTDLVKELQLDALGPQAVQGVRLDGEEVQLEVTLAETYADGHPALVCSVRDLTPLIASQARLERLIRAKDEFVASISHELRTPLTAIVGLSDELQRDDLEDEVERRELISLVASQSREMAHLIEDLLVAARIDIDRVTVRPERCDLAGELIKVARGLSVELPDPQPGVVAFADPLRVRQILRNLVSNAIRYGGSTIDTGTADEGDEVVLWVADDGDGIPREEAERIFDPYYRAGDVPGHPGSIGLGLYVSRSLARLMGGDLHHHCRDGWTVLELRLPPAGRPPASPTM